MDSRVTYLQKSAPPCKCVSFLGPLNLQLANEELKNLPVKMLI